MTGLFNRIAAAGALHVLNGAVAFAQSDMKLDVPFAFQTPNAQLPAGKYLIAATHASPAFSSYRLTHAETGKTVLVMAPVAVIRPQTYKVLPATVAFQCADNVCAISEIFPYTAQNGHRIPVKLRAAKSAQVATVRLVASAE